MNFISKVTSVCLFLFLITACTAPKQSYIPPKDYNFNKSMSFNQEYEAVWEKVILFLGENNIAIDEIDKDSKFIQASYSNSKLEGRVSEFLDCGSKINPRIMISAYIAKFNIIVSGEQPIKVTVNTFFDIEGEKTYNEYWSGKKVSIECNSTGVFENVIFEYINTN